MAGTASSTDWWQVNAEFPSTETAEDTGVHQLAPALEQSGRGWFLMRKKGAWRCRLYLLGPPKTRESVRTRVGASLDGLVRAGHLTGWASVVYEPEVRAFGGPEAMEAAHTLWRADTHHLTRFLRAETTNRRREVSLMLCHALMRAAELDRFEQGDVWDRVAAMRPLPAGSARFPDRLSKQVHQLLSVDPSPSAPHFRRSGSFAGFGPWSQAFWACGQTLAGINARGSLDRGLRAVVAHLVIFHWNRLALPTASQAVLAHAAARTIFSPEEVGL